jgi:hypothetical protein
MGISLGILWPRMTRLRPDGLRRGERGWHGWKEEASKNHFGFRIADTGKMTQSSEVAGALAKASPLIENSLTADDPSSPGRATPWRARITRMEGGSVKKSFRIADTGKLPLKIAQRFNAGETV